MRTRRMNYELTLHDCVRVEIERPTGYEGRRWLNIKFTGPQGEETELCVWGMEDAAPELILEDDVLVRRVKTIGEGE